MLIEFKVANFKSIREEQTLSLVASNADKSLESCVIERALPGLSGVRFLKGAALYGANASGKSNVMEAVLFLANLVKSSATSIQPGQPTGTQPFKLDTASASKPSEFEITFVAEGVRYTYGVAVTPQRVIEERLFAFPKGAPQRWFQRKFDESTGRYDWATSSANFKHDEVLEERTRENALFLSVGPQFNHPQLTRVFSWFRDALHAFSAESLPATFTAQRVDDPDHHDRIVSLLKHADVGVVDAKVQERELPVDEFKLHVSPAEVFRMERAGRPIPTKLLEISLLHQADSTAAIPLVFDDEESAGTVRFFALLGPWLDFISKGYVLFIDEIETSLHPVLVRELLKLVFDKSNDKGAQIIFTTHNPVLLDNALMRRDQIWFTEKLPTGATHLYPLTDYSPRKDEALAKGYLAGRYGGVPYIPDGLKP